MVIIGVKRWAVTLGFDDGFWKVMKKSSFIWLTALGLFGLVVLFVFVGAVNRLPAPTAAANATNATVATVAVVDLTQFADSMNNGTDGGFTLLRVTAHQWEFLKSRGIKLHFFGNVGDQKYPPGFGPILVNSGFFDGATREWLPEKAHPTVFWVAIQTAPAAYAATQETVADLIGRIGLTEADLAGQGQLVPLTIMTSTVPATVMTPQAVEATLPLQSSDGK